MLRKCYLHWENKASPNYPSTNSMEFCFLSELNAFHFSHNVSWANWQNNLDRVKRIWYLSHMRAAKVQASLRICAVSPEPSLLAHTSSESKGTFRQKARSLAPLNGWACAVTICHDGMLEDTNSLGGAHLSYMYRLKGRRNYTPVSKMEC